MPWVSSDAWGFLSFKERKKPREIPGGKKKRRSYAAKRIVLFCGHFGCSDRRKE